MSATIKHLPKSTVEIDMMIPWKTIQGSYDKIFAEVVKQAELPGFRKGKAPADMVSKSIDKAKIYQEVIKDVVPASFSDAVKEHKLSPITSPKVDVLEAKEGEDWKVRAAIAIKPTIKLGDYKKKVKEAKKPKTKIWTPGQEETKEEQKQENYLNEILDALLESVEVEISDLIIDDETNKLLADLLDQTKRLGFTVEQYLMAKGKTTEQIQKEYREQAEKTVKLQFILAEIADVEKITVSQEELTTLIEKAKTTEEKEKLKKDSYYLAHLLRQQKTIDFLNTL